jgi:hypothetical protein
MAMIMWGLTACKQDCACNQLEHDSSTVFKPAGLKTNSQQIHVSPHFLKLQRPRSAFGVHLYLRDDRLYFVFVSSDGHLVFYNLRDTNEVHQTVFPFTASGNDPAMIRIIGDTLLIIPRKDNSFHKLVIQSDFTINEMQNLNLDTLIKKHGWSLSYNTNKFFDYVYPYLLIPYMKPREKKLYDDHAALLVNVTTGEARPVFPFPGCYSGCYLSHEAVSVAISGNNLYGLFSNIGQFVHSKPDSNNFREMILPGSGPHQPYDQKEARNLAYARKYESLNESNVNVLTLEDGSIVMIKRLRRKSFYEPFQLRYYHYNTHDSLLHAGSFPKAFMYNMAIPFKNGFITVNDSLSKSYYYAMD